MDGKEQSMEAMEWILNYFWHDEAKHFAECNGLDDWKYGWNWEEGCDPLPENLSDVDHVFVSLVAIREWLIQQTCEV